MYFASKKAFRKKSKKPSSSVSSNNSDDDDYDEFDESELNQGVAEAYSMWSNNGGSRGRVGGGSKLSRRRRAPKANTNVITISLGTLAEDVTLATGDPTVCSTCSAYFNVHSSLNRDTNTWQCKFCQTTNHDVILDEEEVPTEEVTDYMLEPPRQTSSSGGEADESIVVYVLDISGSMCVTTEVDGKVDVKGASKPNAQELRGQRLPGQKRNVTYISRLQCMQAAVEAQMIKMAEENPTRKCVLVAFNGQVTILGDGSSGARKVIAGDRLNNYDEILAVGEAYDQLTPIEESVMALTKKLYELEEEGATALGPALLAAVGIAKQKPASRVVLCTDGLANVGIGAMEDVANPEEVAEVYTRIGNLAKDNGVTVSLVSIEGTDCNIEHVGIVTDISQGDVDIANPLTLKDQFAALSKEPVVAVKTTLTFLLSEHMAFRNEPGATGNIAHRDIGNVTASTDITFEYDFVTPPAKPGSGELTLDSLSTTTTSTTSVSVNDPMDEEAVESAQEFLGWNTGCSIKDILDEERAGGDDDQDEGPTEAIFQTQIHYERLNGMKAVRVITKTLAITDQREEAEAEVDLTVLGLHGVQLSAKMAQDGDYEGSRMNNLAIAQMMARSAQTNEQREQAQRWVSETTEMDSELIKAQEEEKRDGLAFDDDDGFSNSSSNSVSSGFLLKKASRANRRGDRTAKVLYKKKKASLASWKS